jgi:hypothetical protein
MKTWELQKLTFLRNSLIIIWREGHFAHVARNLLLVEFTKIGGTQNLGRKQSYTYAICTVTILLCNSAGGGGNSFTLVLDLMVYCSADFHMIPTGDRWDSGAGSRVDSSVLARSSLRLGLMSGLDGVGRWP